MSYTQLITFNDGLPERGPEFSNAWGGAARIWSSLFDKYLKNPAIPYDTWLSRLSREDNSLWDLAKRTDLPVFERAVHMFTFDLAYVSKDNFDRLSEHLREFAEDHRVYQVDHLCAWADAIDAMEGVEAVGLYATSVSENVWFEYDEEKDESMPVPLSRGFEVYKWIELLSAQPTR